MFYLVAIRLSYITPSCALTRGSVAEDEFGILSIQRERAAYDDLARLYFQDLAAWFCRAGEIFPAHAALGGF
jgi:hypothetical protein